MSFLKACHIVHTIHQFLFIYEHVFSEFPVNLLKVLENDKKKSSTTRLSFHFIFALKKNVMKLQLYYQADHISAFLLSTQYLTTDSICLKWLSINLTKKIHKILLIHFVLLKKG